MSLSALNACGGGAPPPPPLPGLLPPEAGAALRPYAYQVVVGHLRAGQHHPDRQRAVHSHWWATDGRDLWDDVARAGGADRVGEPGALLRVQRALLRAGAHAGALHARHPALPRLLHAHPPRVCGDGHIHLRVVHKGVLDFAAIRRDAVCPHEWGLSLAAAQRGRPGSLHWHYLPQYFHAVVRMRRHECIHDDCDALVRDNCRIS
mmetsp:Transcript_5802/g.10062  ORF Transcript_5802/g.10062 Transcript_5802/m.10062 type:complete len:205 (+) Transcript_5802:1340-1954(+)